VADNRGQGVNLPAPNVGLPPRPFLYTIDQLAVVLNMREENIKNRYLYLEGRSIGVRRKDLMVARNIALREEKPDWRVTEREFIRWMKLKGFKYYERGTFA
jgi:hypothetical protein